MTVKDKAYYDKLVADAEKRLHLIKRIMRVWLWMCVAWAALVLLAILQYIIF